MSFLTSTPVLTPLRKFINRRSGRALGVLKASGGSLFNFLTNQAAALITIPLIVQYLGTSLAGVWLTITSLVAWLWLCNFGLGLSMQNRLSTAFGEGDPVRMERIFATGFISQALIFAATAVLGLGILPFVPLGPLFGFAENNFPPDLSAAVALIFVLSLFGMLFQLSSTAMLAMRVGHLYYFWSIAGNLTTVPALVLVVHLNGGFVGLVGALVFTRTIFLAGSFVHLLVLMPNFRRMKSNWTILEVPGLFSTGLWFMLGQLSTLVMQNSQNTIVSSAVGAEEVPSFAISLRLLSLPSMALMFLLSGLLPAYREAQAAGHWAWVRRTFKRSIILCIATAGATFVLALASPWIIRHWVGPQVEPPWPLVGWLAGYSAINCFTMGLTALAYALDSPRLAAVVTSIYGVCLISIGYLATLHHGVQGLAAFMFIGMTITIVVPLGVYLPRLLRRRGAATKTT